MSVPLAKLPAPKLALAFNGNISDPASGDAIFKYAGDASFADNVSEAIPFCFPRLSPSGEEAFIKGKG